MDTFTVQVFPVARPDEWATFMEEISEGGRADAHREMLRRLGVTREHIYRMSSPMGELMVLVWEGVPQDKVGDLMSDMLQHPQSEHERYLGTHVIPKLHGVDPTAGPPPELRKIGTIES